MESRTKTPHEVLHVNGLAKVTNDPIVQGACPHVFVRVGLTRIIGIACPISVRRLWSSSPVIAGI